MTPSELSHLSARKWILGAFALAGMFWVFDSFAAFLFVKNSDFIGQLFSPGMDKIYYRVCILIILCLSGYFRYLEMNDWSLSYSSDPDETDMKEEEDGFHIREIFDNSSLAMMTLDELGFLDCNQATLDLFGIQHREEFVSMHPGDLSPPKQPDGIDSMSTAFRRIEQVIKDRSVQFEWVHRRKNGKSFWALVSLTSFRVGSKPRIFATVQDISAYRKLEDESGMVSRIEEEETSCGLV